MAEVFLSTQDLIAALEREKLIVTPCQWVTPNSTLGQRRLALKASLSDGTSTLPGIGLRIECNVEGLELPFTMVLTADYKGKPHAMARIDINGQRHENRLALCGALQFSDAGTTHFHDTALHSHIELSRLFGDPYLGLPIARAINDMPSDFRNVLEKCGELLHIRNLTEIEEPQWQPRQLF